MVVFASHAASRVRRCSGFDGGGVGVGGGSGRLGNFEIYLLLFRACECLVAFRVRQLHSSVTIVDVHRQLNMLLSLRSG